MSVHDRTLERLADAADVLAGAWSARALASTTPGRERALLRLAGVTDLDREGRPLAWAVVDRYLAGRPDRLPGGILPVFAVASLEYELPPQELALEVAAGAVDLGLEAELLVHPDARARAEAEASRWAVAALERIDANRTARTELLDVLGDADEPWIAASIGEPEAEDAVEEAEALVGAGIDLVRVAVPAGRELVERMHAVGVELEPWQPRQSAEGRRGRQEVAPAGSQRGLARLRAELDEVAAARRSYVRLAAASPSLAAPEQAAVAAFERVDVVEADPMAEIVAGVDPDRVLADHAFAHRLMARAGTALLVGPGPLVVAPDLARGVPSTPVMLAGRALALQLVAVALARRNGLAPSRIVVGALPGWIADERTAATHAIAAAVLRRRLFPDHPLALEEPERAQAGAAWPWAASAAIAAADGVTLVATRATARDAQARAVGFRAMAAAAGEAAASGARGRLEGPAADVADGAIEAARTLLERLGDEGWRAVVGDPPTGRGVRGLGAGAVAERSDPFDAFGIASPG